MKFIKHVKPGDWKLVLFLFMILFAPYAWSAIYLFGLRGGYGVRDSIIYATIVIVVGGFLFGLAFYRVYVILRRKAGTGKPV
jgi:hypothetical protein